MEEKVVIFLLAILSGIIIAGTIILIVFFIKQYKERVIEAVEKTSEKLKKIKMVNNKYQFNNVEDHLRTDIFLNTKQKFDKFNFDNEMLNLLDRDTRGWQKWIDQIYNNRECFKNYIAEVKAINSSAKEEDAKAYKISFNKYQKKEEELFEKNKLSPAISGTFTIAIRYTSPQGRNTYNHAETYKLEEVEHLLNKVYENNEFKNSKLYQRKILTPSMRYDVMQRDGFKCVLCGRGAAEGALLEVDHIIPVSKGGKTIMSNLRTLCRDCNRGKSDKYNENIDN